MKKNLILVIVLFFLSVQHQYTLMTEENNSHKKILKIHKKKNTKWKSKIECIIKNISGPYLGQKLPEVKPEIFAPGIVSTFMRDGTPVITPNGKEIFYPIYIKEQNKKGGLVGTIVTLKEENGVWSFPKVAKFSGSDNDSYITMHPNGKIIYFNSTRKTNRNDLKDRYNIWQVKKTTNGWSKASPLEPPINGNGDISCFSVTNNSTAYFTIMNKTSSKIYRSKYIKGKYQKPEILPKSINTTEMFQFDSYISPNEDYIILPVYNRKDSFGSTDLYVSFRNKQDRWSSLINLGPKINNKHTSGTAFISSNGKLLFFSANLEKNKDSKRPRTYQDLLQSYGKPDNHHGVKTPLNDIYWVSTKLIYDLKPKGY